jgi:hypothetical protein
LKDSRPSRLYTLTLTTLTTLGYGDIAPVSTAGRTVSMIVATSGLLLVFGVGLEAVRETLGGIMAGRKRQMNAP